MPGRLRTSMIWLWRWVHRWSAWSILPVSDCRRRQMRWTVSVRSIWSRRWHREWFRRSRLFLAAAAADLPWSPAWPTSPSWRRRKRNYSSMRPMHWKAMKFPDVIRLRRHSRVKRQVLWTWWPTRRRSWRRSDSWFPSCPATMRTSLWMTARMTWTEHVRRLQTVWEILLSLCPRSRMTVCL